MGKSLGAYLSGNVLFQGIQREQRSVETVEHWRTGIGALEQLVSRQKVSGSGKSTWHV